MIQDFIDRFMENKSTLRATFAERHPTDYVDIVIHTIKAISDNVASGPDPENIIKMSHGIFHGTNLYIMPDKDEHADTEFWYVCVLYGSCSGCDTLESIQSDGDYTDTPSEKQVDDYMTLALHIAQAIKKLDTSVGDL
ncbi:MAG: hypothetical protein WCT23_09585 [Candidatus Neomarinimicrobiota bacterium]